MKISVCVITYNHEKYIAAALEAILMQRGDFILEVIVSDDCSQDSTKEICMEYKNEFPEEIIYSRNETNLGVMPNLKRALELCTGDFIAFCEGDDYWIDPRKLHKQLLLMKDNPQASMCFHNAITLWEYGNRDPEIFHRDEKKRVLNTNDIITNYVIPSASMLMRSNFLRNLPPWFVNIYNGDWALQLILSHSGPVLYLDEYLSIYRKNSQALSNKIGKKLDLINNHRKVLLENFNQYSDFKYDKQISFKIEELKKETRKYLWQKNSKVIYYLVHPLKLIKKLA